MQGVAIFSGKETTLKIRTWTPDEKQLFSSYSQEQKKMISEAKGRLFCSDLSELNPLYLPAHLHCVVDTSKRTTVLGGTSHLMGSQGSESSQVQSRFSMVEHLLAALEAESIYNVIIEIDQEIPMLDGSSVIWCELLRSKKEPIENFQSTRSVVSSQELGKVEFYPSTTAGAMYVLIPADDEKLRLSVMIDFPSEPLILTQSHSISVDERFSTSFFEEIAPARTFCSIKELTLLQKMGLIRAGGTDNGLVYDQGEVLSKDGLRYTNEMARHKLLDVVGDFSLFPFDLTGHLIAIKPSHAGNIAFGNHLLQMINRS